MALENEWVLKLEEELLIIVEEKEIGVIAEEKRVKELKSDFLNKYVYFFIGIFILLLVVIFFFVSR